MGEETEMKRGILIAFAAIAAFLGFSFGPSVDCGYNCKIAGVPTIATISFVAPAMAGEFATKVAPKVDKNKFVFRWRVAYEGCKKKGSSLKVSLDPSNPRVDLSVSLVWFFAGDLMWVDTLSCNAGSGVQIVYTEGDGGWQIVPPPGVQAIRLQVNLVPRTVYDQYKSGGTSSWSIGSRSIYNEPSR